MVDLAAMNRYNQHVTRQNPWWMKRRRAMKLNRAVALADRVLAKAVRVLLLADE